MSDNQLTIHDIRKRSKASFFLVPTLSFPFTRLVKNNFPHFYPEKFGSIKINSYLCK